MKPIKHHDNQITLLHRELGLLTNGFVQYEILLAHQRSGVDKSEWEIVPRYELIVAIAGYSRLILYNRFALSYESVEEG
jgi:hypothetical protein